MSINNIERINVNRYSKKAKRLSSGFVGDKTYTLSDMLSNFVEHCYRNINDLNGYDSKLYKLNYVLNK